MTRLLEVRNLTAGYGPVTVLRDVSLHLDEGESLGLFGPNGHGKTTLLSTISGLLKPAAGEIAFAGNADRRDQAAR